MVRTKASIGNRGKWAEKQVRDFLEALNNDRLDFAYHRLPDPRAARGVLAAQPSDFMAQVGDSVAGKATFYFIEVKETEHDYRLPYTKIRQYAILRKWMLAGAMPFVITFHSIIEKWRVMFLDELVERREAATGNTASWDLRDFNTYSTLDEALAARFIFK